MSLLTTFFKSPWEPSDSELSYIRSALNRPLLSKADVSHFVNERLPKIIEAFSTLKGRISAGLSDEEGVTRSKAAFVAMRELIHTPLRSSPFSEKELFELSKCYCCPITIYEPLHTSITPLFRNQIRNWLQYAGDAGLAGKEGCPKELQMKYYARGEESTPTTRIVPESNLIRIAFPSKGYSIEGISPLIPDFKGENTLHLEVYERIKDLKESPYLLIPSLAASPEDAPSLFVYDGIYHDTSLRDTHHFLSTAEAILLLHQHSLTLCGKLPLTTVEGTYKLKPIGSAIPRATPEQMAQDVKALGKALQKAEDEVTTRGALPLGYNGLLRSMTCKDPTKRPTMREVVIQLRKLKSIDEFRPAGAGGGGEG